MFKCKDLGQQYLKAVAKHQVYATAMKSNKGPHGQSQYFYCTRCHQNYKFASVKEKVNVQPPSGLSNKDLSKPQKSSEAKLGCDFGLYLKYCKSSGHWKVKVQHTCHNHKPFCRADDIPRLRPLKPSEQESISTLKEANFQPRAIQLMLPGESAH